MKQRIDYKGWVLLAIIVLVPAYIIYTSTETAYPHLLSIMGGVLTITAGTALWFHWNSNEPDDEVRQAGMVAMAALAIFGGLNVWAHITLTRDISAAEEAKIEYRDAENWAQAKKDREANRALKLAGGQIAVTEAQKALTLAEARKLNALPYSQRKNVAPKTDSQPVLISPDLAANTDAIPAPTPGQTTSVPVKTAADVRNERRGMIVFLLMCEMLIAITGGAWVQAKKSWDGNSNGVPDFVERIFLNNPDYVANRWPEHFAMLQPQPSQNVQPQRHVPGFTAPATASVQPTQQAQTVSPVRRPGFFRRVFPK